MPGREVVGVKHVKVTVRRDPEDHGFWLVHVDGEPGARTFGRSLGESKRRGIEVVALWCDLEPDQFEIDWDLRLGDIARTVKEAKAAIAHADEDRTRRDQAVRTLTEAAVNGHAQPGVSYRDVAELLGLSHQRVAQIARAS